MIDIVVYIIIGLLCGISMGSIGIGAGLISVPLLIYYGLNICLLYTSDAADE